MKKLIIPALVVLVGCTKSTALPSDQPTPTAQTATDLYNRFLDGEISAYVNVENVIPEGDYTYAQLKAQFQEADCVNHVRSSIVYPEEDEDGLLFVDFISTDENLLTWHQLVTLDAKDENVYATAWSEYAYSNNVLCEQGYSYFSFEDEDSYEEIIHRYDQNGQMSETSRTCCMKGSSLGYYAEQYMGVEMPDLTEDDVAILEQSGFEVLATTYADEKRFVVDGLSNDEETRTVEDRVISYLIEAGFEKNDEDTLVMPYPMLKDLTPVTWTYDNLSNATIFCAEDTTNSNATYYCSLSEDAYAAHIRISTDTLLKELSVVELDFYEGGDPSVRKAKKIYPVGELSDNQSLLMKVLMCGTMPNIAISCDRGDGVIRTYEIGFSGKDGSVYLNEITLSE